MMQMDCPAPTSPRGSAARTCSFTLIEMIVVVAIVVILVALILPAANTMWEERKLADAETTIQGMLQTSRAKALQASGVETGMFFFVDNGGVQHIVPIKQGPGEQDLENLGNPAWENVFRVVPGRVYSLPAPMRVVPRYVVEEDPDDEHPARVFSEEELARNDFRTLPPDGEVNNAQRHRNFFTMVFSNDGELVVWRDVLIQDADHDGDGEGDTSGLHVDYRLDPPKAPEVYQYYPQNKSNTPKLIDPTINVEPPDERKIPLLVNDVDSDHAEVAINFPSVDGLLVYNDALLNGIDTASEKRAFLLRTARPFYVNRNTGAVIRGPLGENVP